MKIGDKIKKIRELKGLTQEELAQKLNITPQAYSKLERNKTKMDEDRLEHIAEQLGVSMDIIREFEPNNLFINNTHAIGNSSKMVIKNFDNQQVIQLITEAKDEIIAQQKETINKQQTEIEFLRQQIAQLTSMLQNNQ